MGFLRVVTKEDLTNIINRDKRVDYVFKDIDETRKIAFIEKSIPELGDIRFSIEFDEDNEFRNTRLIDLDKNIDYKSDLGLSLLELSNTFEEIENHCDHILAPYIKNYLDNQGL